LSGEERLLLLYPRAWRERYGEEFLALLGEGPLSATEWVDVVRGALDAWLSPEVRRAAPSERLATSGGRTMRLKALMACERRSPQVTAFDAVAGAGVMIGVSLLFLAARGLPWPDGGKAVASLAFPVALAASMPFWLMRGVPRKVQAVIVGGTLTILALIGYLSAR
jgi:hypothetical protein